MDRAHRHQILLRRFGVLSLAFVMISGCAGPAEDVVGSWSTSSQVGEEVAGVQEISDKGRWEEHVHRNAIWAYLQDGFEMDDPGSRQMAGNLNMVATAFWLESAVSPSPQSLEAFLQTPSFRAVSLWDPYKNGPATVVEGPLPEGEPGTYLSWAEGKWRWFAAMTSTGLIQTRREIRDMGFQIEGDESTLYEEPEEWRGPLAFCRLLAQIAHNTKFAFPGVFADERPQPEDFEGFAKYWLSPSVAPPSDLEGLMPYWNLWDATSFLGGSPFPQGALRLVVSGERRFVDCQTPKGSVWLHGRSSYERDLLSQLEVLSPSR